MRREKSLGDSKIFSGDIFKDDGNKKSLWGDENSAQPSKVKLILVILSSSPGPEPVCCSCRR